MQPENGGLGVFAHEFGHDLGLPDLYDTSGNTGGAENNTAFWTLMSSGANIGDGSPDGIGDAPTDMGAWERLQLGWLDAQGGQGPFYDVVQPGEHKAVQLGPNTPNTKKPSAVISLLPDKDQLIDIGAPFAGSWMFWSGQGNNTREHHDPQRHRSRGDDGDGQGALRDREGLGLRVPRGVAQRNRLDAGPHQPVHVHRPELAERWRGHHGYHQRRWVDLSGTVPAGTTSIRFRYWTDVAAVGVGHPHRQHRRGWHGHRHRRDPGRGLGVRRLQPPAAAGDREAVQRLHRENRQYDGYDKSLATAYNFGFLGTAKDNWVETHPYMPGLLITYWDDSYEDNNVGEHPGTV
jgi:immune inhibitor A